jgi:hypothetical protein
VLRWGGYYYCEVFFTARVFFTSDLLLLLAIAMAMACHEA